MKINEIKVSEYANKVFCKTLLMNLIFLILYNWYVSNLFVFIISIGYLLIYYWLAYFWRLKELKSIVTRFMIFNILVYFIYFIFILRILLLKKFYMLCVVSLLIQIVIFKVCKRSTRNINVENKSTNIKIANIVRQIEKTPKISITFGVISISLIFKSKISENFDIIIYQAAFLLFGYSLCYLYYQLRYLCKNDIDYVITDYV